MKQHPDESTFAKFRAFPEVDQYLAAERVVKRKDEEPRSTIDTRFYEQLIQDSAAKLAQRVRETWGERRNGEPNWPKGHWTGIGKLRERAKELGPDCLDEYVKVYSVLSTLIHSGPDPEHGDLTWLERHVAVGYINAFRYAKAATIVVCELLGIRSNVGLAMQQFDRREHDAMERLGAS